LINDTPQLNAFNVNFTINLIDINMIIIKFGVFISFSIKFSKFKVPITNGSISYRDDFLHQDEFNITIAKRKTIIEPYTMTNNSD
jgi:hypothetical protein